MIKRSLLCIVVLALVLMSCASKIKTLPLLENPPVFAPLSESEPNMLVGLAISGGGSRAATFAAGVLEALGELKIGDRSLLERVQYISSVSGGSLAAAYYAHKKPEKKELVLIDQGMSPVYEKFFTSYKAAMQENFERPAWWWQWWSLRWPDTTRLAYSMADVWDNKFFDRTKFADLYKREQAGDSPRVILNGTVYSTGQRFALTTLPASEFKYNLAELLIKDMGNPKRGNSVTPEDIVIIEKGLKEAEERLKTLTFDEIKLNHQKLRLSLGVASSASFPPLLGPVTYEVESISRVKSIRYHIYDGGLFDNLGIESLTALFLTKLSKESTRKGLIIVIDASYPFETNINRIEREHIGIHLLKKDPTRVVGIMEERAKAYQSMLRYSLQIAGKVLPDQTQLRFVELRHTDAKWSDHCRDLPEECRSEFQCLENSGTLDPEKIKQVVSRIPTKFQINKCDAALLIMAAHKVVKAKENRDKIVKYFETKD